MASYRELALTRTHTAVAIVARQAKLHIMKLHVAILDRMGMGDDQKLTTFCAFWMIDVL